MSDIGVLGDGDAEEGCGGGHDDDLRVEVHCDDSRWNVRSSFRSTIA